MAWKCYLPSYASVKPGCDIWGGLVTPSSTLTNRRSTGTRIVLETWRTRFIGRGARIDAESTRFAAHADLAGSSSALPPTAEGVLHAASLREAIRWTVTYGSIFDYPLTRDEVYRYLMAPGGSRAEVDAAIDDALMRGNELESNGRFLYPSGQCNLVSTRLRRAGCARAARAHARRYARLIWMLPYVRMVAITGSLAMDNVEDGDDIDLMIVTEPGRLWMTRGMILVVVKLAQVRGHTLCPNYILSSRALTLQQRDTYAAHELAQMDPIHGRYTALRLWSENAWCREFLPNAQWRGDDGTVDELPWILTTVKALAERVLRLPPGSWIEGWEQKRKIAKLSRGAPEGGRETHYTADVCKGHVDGHGGKVTNLWRARVGLPSDRS